MKRGSTSAKLCPELVQKRIHWCSTMLLHRSRGPLRPVAIHSRTLWSELNDQVQKSQQDGNASLTVHVKHISCSARCRRERRPDVEEKCMKTAEMKGYMLSSKV